jgi:hypothetical protein
VREFADERLSGAIEITDRPAFAGMPRTVSAVAVGRT